MQIDWLLVGGAVEHGVRGAAWCWVLAADDDLCRRR